MRWVPIVFAVLVFTGCAEDPSYGCDASLERLELAEVGFRSGWYGLSPEATSSSLDISASWGLQSYRATRFGCEAGEWPLAVNGETYHHEAWSSAGPSYSRRLVEAQVESAHLVLSYVETMYYSEPDEHTLTLEFLVEDDELVRVVRTDLNVDGEFSYESELSWLGELD